MKSTQSILINLVHLCLLDINFNPDFSGQIKVQIHYSRSKPNRNGLVLFTYQDIFTNFSAKRQKMLYKSTMLKPFKSLSLQEVCKKLILYMIYMEIHKTILHHPMKMMISKIAKNTILIQI